MKTLAAWILRRALGADRAAPVLGDLDEELGRAPGRAAHSPGLRLLCRAVAFAVAVRWAERRPFPLTSGSMWQDGRYAARTLRRAPWGFVAAAAMLGLAIGITTAMFTVVDALMLRPVPFKDADRIVQLYMGTAGGGISTIDRPTFRAWRAQHTFEAVEGARSATVLIGTEAGDVAGSVARVTPGLFDMLGDVRPLHGRLFGADEGRPESEDAALLSEALWRSGFGADPAVVGRRITVADQSVTVVGILSDEFRFPDWNIAIWQADTFETSLNGSANADRVIAYVRLASGVPEDDALRLATAVALEAGAQPDLSAQTRPLNGSNLDETDARAVRLLAGGVVLLFIVLCANVSSLMLAGLTARQHELATRAALGASRQRLVSQAFVENVLVGLAGVAAGFGIASALVSAARTLIPQAVLLQSLNPLNLDARALVASSVLGLVATVGAGVLPALIGTRVDPSRRLNSSGRTGTESPRARMAARTLLVAQVALSCTLLIGATVLVRSFAHLSGADRGLDVSNILVARVALTAPVFATPESRADAARAIIDQARVLPGVSHASWSYGTPPGGAIGYDGDWASDAPAATPQRVNTSQSLVDADYFALYGVPILRGRTFLSSDGRDAAVLSERLARAVFGDEDPVGRHVTWFDTRGMRSGMPDREVIRVVGVARDTRLPSLDSDRDTAQIYRRVDPSLYTPMLSLRCAGPCPGEGLIRRQLGDAQPAAEISSITSVERQYLRELARPRAAAALASGFAVTALLAAAAGIFSLLSYAVARRRREFGIRSALGASAASLRGLLWRDGAGVVVMGVGFGVLGSLLVTRVLSSLLYDVTMADPANWAIVIAAIVAAVAAASWRPARAAVRADPLLLLRDE